MAPEQENPLVSVDLTTQANINATSYDYMYYFGALVTCEKTSPRECCIELVLNGSGGPPGTNYYENPSMILFSGIGEFCESVRLSIHPGTHDDGIRINWTLDGTYYLKGTESEVYDIEEVRGTVLFVNNYIPSQEELERKENLTGIREGGGGPWILIGILVIGSVFVISTLFLLARAIIRKR